MALFIRIMSASELFSQKSAFKVKFLDVYHCCYFFRGGGNQTHDYPLNIGGNHERNIERNWSCDPGHDDHTRGIHPVYDHVRNWTLVVYIVIDGSQMAGEQVQKYWPKLLETNIISSFITIYIQNIVKRIFTVFTDW